MGWLYEQRKRTEQNLDCEEEDEIDEIMRKWLVEREIGRERFDNDEVKIRDLEYVDERDGQK
ncbi:hypothetical protein J6590_038922 [Homalodisca vitripennis]|nr:hypothetical protein J6590_038922 [Homalodisca vitripennis]